MKRTLFLLCLCVLASLSRAEARLAPYVLEVSGPTAPGFMGTTVRLRYRASRRVVWSRKFDCDKDDVGTPLWANNRRAVAVELPGKIGYQILVWREGYRLRAFDVPVGDWTYDLQWSPDNRRLLMTVGASEPVGMGLMFCLTLKRWPFYHLTQIGSSRVVRFKWRDARTVIYWVSADEIGTDITRLLPPRLWRVP